MIRGCAVWTLAARMHMVLIVVDTTVRQDQVEKHPQLNSLTSINHQFHNSIVKLLFDDGRIYPSVIDSNGNNCLHLSSWYRRDITVNLLLDDGRVDPGAVNNVGYNYSIYT
jgi:ankyrin repeat protein